MTSLDEMFARQARRTPSATAAVDDDGTLDYATLDARVTDVAAALRDAGVRPDQPVGLILDRSVQMAVAVLAVLRAGGAYVPIEPETPPAKRAAILADAAATVCVVEPALAEEVRAAGRTAVVPADVPRGAKPAEPTAPHPDQLCALYYTSGSTGRPKGVACTHGGWANRMRWMQERHHLQPGETVLQKTTLTFDDAAVELLWPLLVGGRVALLAPGAHRDPRAIIDAAIRHEAVHLQFVPSVFDLFLETLTDADVAGLTRLRSVLCSGEALRPELVRRFFARFPDGVSLDNTWGATEVSIDSTFHICRPADGLADGASVPIGAPMTGNRVTVRDDRHRPVRVGEVGELCIGGVGLARGYQGDPRRTAAAFVPDPDGFGARMYRTGDRGAQRPDGTLAFVDRVDHQVKIRGVRIELGEVETALRGHPEIADAVVLALGTGTKHLAAYLVPRQAGACSVDDVRAHLRGLLTSYAVPTHFTVLDRLPLHPNGKVDRAALAALPVPGADEGALLAPRTITEETVAEIWCAVLGVERIGVDQDFFAAGGHSLLAVRILSRLRQAFGLDIPLRLIFDHPTIAASASELERLVLADLKGAAR
ncbi:non-ribosomal peptide synthetase [Micromonospora sp. CPCC 205539]|uniref:non-ribosomal peptide synthetase n=1 Tax=Micromonospora sp. CPCC 205539 TaxID=3122408 RepID=UPI002FF23140